MVKKKAVCPLRADRGSERVLGATHGQSRMVADLQHVGQRAGQASSQADSADSFKRKLPTRRPWSTVSSTACDSERFNHCGHHLVGWLMLPEPQYQPRCVDQTWTKYVSSSRLGR